MSFILNESDVESAQILAAHDFHRPNLQMAVLTLARLVEWTNANSDGWPYWRKPAAASKRLQETVSRYYFGRERLDADLTARDLKAACTPIRAFLTRQGVAHSEVFPND